MDDQVEELVEKFWAKVEPKVADMIQIKGQDISDGISQSVTDTRGSQNDEFWHITKQDLSVLKDNLLEVTAVQEEATIKIDEVNKKVDLQVNDLTTTLKALQENVQGMQGLSDDMKLQIASVVNEHIA